MYLCIRATAFYDFDIRFLNRSDNVLFFDFLLDFGIIPKGKCGIMEWYRQGGILELSRKRVILELFRRCGIMEWFRQGGILELSRKRGILELFRRCGIMELFR